MPRKRHGEAPDRRQQPGHRIKSAARRASDTGTLPRNADGVHYRLSDFRRVRRASRGLLKGGIRTEPFESKLSVRRYVAGGRGASSFDLIEELQSAVARDISDSPESIEITIGRFAGDVMEGSKVDPVAGFRGFCEFDAPPGSEGEAEASAVHSLDDLIKEAWSVQECVAEGFADVFGDIAAHVVLVADEADIEDGRVFGDVSPSGGEIALRDEAAVNDAVNMNIPGVDSGTPLDLSKSTAAVDTAPPELSLTESGEARI